MMGTLRFFSVLLFFALAAADTSVEVVDVDQNNPEVQACVSFAVESYNHFSKDPHLYVISKFISVKMLVIGAGEYVMDVELGNTACLKESNPDPKSCQALTGAEAKVLKCHFVVLSAPWKDQRLLIESSCKPQ